MLRCPLAAAVAVMLVFAAPAGAITFGGPGGDGHPNVGGLVAESAYSDGAWNRLGARTRMAALSMALQSGKIRL